MGQLGRARAHFVAHSRGAAVIHPTPTIAIDRCIHHKFNKQTFFRAIVLILDGRCVRETKNARSDFSVGDKACPP